MGKKKTKRGMHPNSRANIQKNIGKFAQDPTIAQRAGEQSGRTRRTRAQIEAMLDENLNEALDTLAQDTTMQEFIEGAKTGHNQLQRILTREFSDPKKAFAAVQWAFDRVKGRAVQQVEQTSTLRSDDARPVIVFRDIAKQVEQENAKSEE